MFSSPFWNGFILGAILFGFIGTAVGIWIFAMCQAAAGDDHRRGFIDGDEQYRHITAGCQPDHEGIQHTRYIG